MSTPQSDFDSLLAEIRANPKYARMDLPLTEFILRQELEKNRSAKETIKAVRNKLHQIGGAFQEKPIDYAKWLTELKQLSPGLHQPQMRAFCQDKMAWHISTAERLPILDSFYTSCLASIGPVHSLLDLASGLNPLAYSWLNLASDAAVTSADIYQDQADFLNQFYVYNQVNGRALVADITHSLPEGTFDLALLLKTIPCLEQLDRGVGRRLLTSINARHILVTFPGHSLAGRGKGMRATYSAHFQEIIAGLDFSVLAFEFPGEIAYLLSRPQQEQAQ
jgi:16S rRNA (guanine(1405)-N(7))-methyltransferase